MAGLVEVMIKSNVVGSLNIVIGGRSSMVEPQPSKLIVAVRSRSPAPDISRPLLARPYSSVVEHFLGKEGVTGSIPVMGSIDKPI